MDTYAHTDSEVRCPVKITVHVHSDVNTWKYSKHQIKPLGQEMYLREAYMQIRLTFVITSKHFM